MFSTSSVAFGFRFYFSFQPLAFDLQDGAVADGIADARLQGARASRARRSASRRTLDAEAVRNKTL
jgi:hypothetical protein